MDTNREAREVRVLFGRLSTIRFLFKGMSITASTTACTLIYLRHRIDGHW